MICLKNKDFLKLLDFTPEEIAYLLELAADLKAKKKAGIPHALCQGKNIALIFEKTSTRTRCAFEVAGHDLGMGVTYLDPTGSQIGKKESIADTARVRLGAYIGEGTTVMHEGFVNFNAGTEGPGMIEGRVSAGVFVGKGSDLGGGCSTMGTLSGGGNIVISVGEGCLIGANAGIGIPLGDRNIVEAGLYITAGTKVALLDEQNALVKVVKARDLAGQPDLLFRRNSQNGAVECKTNKTAIELNEALHAHN